MPVPPAADALTALADEIVACRACPRLVEWRERVGREKRASFASEEYWARPLPGFGDPAARVLILGLAPAAHGANRTGRVFTGDRSGDFLFAALHRAGLANQPDSVSVDDGLRLHDCFVTAAVRCAPPANAPTPSERDTCAPFLRREIELLRNLSVVVALGQFAWEAAARHWRVRPKPRFGHGATAGLAPGLSLIGSFHPSQQNTFTGKLTSEMLDDVLSAALAAAD